MGPLKCFILEKYELHVDINLRVIIFFQKIGFTPYLINRSLAFFTSFLVRGLILYIFSGTESREELLFIIFPTCRNHRTFYTNSHNWA